MPRKHIERRDIDVSEAEIEEILATEGKFRRECRRRETKWLGAQSALQATGLLYEDFPALQRSLGKVGKATKLSQSKIVDLSRRFHAGEIARKRLEEHEGDIKDAERSRLERLVEMGVLAKQHMAMGTMGLVVILAKKYYPGHFDYTDYFQAGVSGLMRAISMYDYTMGHAFGTYAEYWIRDAFQSARGKEGYLIPISATGFNEYRKIVHAHGELTDSSVKEPTAADIARVVEMKEERVAAIMLTRHPSSLDVKVVGKGQSGKDTTIGDFIPDESPESQIEESAIRNQFCEDIDALVSTLSEDEEYIIRHKFGLGGAEILTFGEIGKHFGIGSGSTYVRCRKILSKLQQSPKASAVQAYLTP
jgi:RNA polymerase sigma factor (sigma-70 family)